MKTTRGNTVTDGPGASYIPTSATLYWTRWVPRQDNICRKWEVPVIALRVDNGEIGFVVLVGDEAKLWERPTPETWREEDLFDCGISESLPNSLCTYEWILIKLLREAQYPLTAELHKT